MNLGEALERVLRDSSDDFLDGIATGGTTASLIDTSIINKYNNNKFAGVNPWTIFITSSAAGPQNQYQTVSSNVAATGTITFPAMTLPISAGDAYAVCRPAIPIHTLEKRLNDSLSRMYYPNNDTSLITAVQKLEYTLPVGITKYTLRKVYIQSIINITNVNYWVETSDYFVKPSIGGTQDVLIFNRQPTPLRTIMLETAIPHPKLRAFLRYHFGLYRLRPGGGDGSGTRDVVEKGQEQE